MLTISEKNMNSCPERSDTVPGSRFFSGKRVSLNNFIGLVQSVDRETMIFRLSCASCGDALNINRSEIALDGFFFFSKTGVDRIGTSRLY